VEEFANLENTNMKSSAELGISELGRFSLGKDIINVPTEEETDADDRKLLDLTSEVSASSSRNQDVKTSTEPELVCLSRRCIESGLGVSLCPEGVGGTYFIHDEKHERIAVFKAEDEEPGGINDPKSKIEVPLLPPGGGFQREIAAWLLDHGNHAGVPETHYMANVSHSAFNCDDTRSDSIKKLKSGSIQKYVPNIGNAESMSSSRFLTSDVHNLGILDLRLFNMDRNLENILVTKQNDTYRLTPIDHSYTLPDKLDGAYFDWLYWNHTKVPFSKQNLQYIDSLDIEQDAEILSSLGIGEDCVRTMKISTTWLKHGAKAGLTLFDIAYLVCRRRNDEESFLERLVAKAVEYSSEDGTKFFQVFDRLVKEVVEKIKNGGVTTAFNWL